MSIAAFRMLALDQLHESALNPRKSFDAERLAELADSIRTKGVLQPIVARPNADGFEIVCGARRFRAAKSAGLTELPTIVRELTDTEVLEVAVIENLQRADVHPLEEAEGYEKLLELGHNVDDLAAKVGKSRAYVYARMKLCALAPKAREAFYDGKLNPSTALLVARIPTTKLQEQATKEITEVDHRGEVLPVRQAAEHIHRNYMLRLKEAPFATTDAKLVTKAGACGECPMRTGNQPELFSDVGNADVCTDPSCFAAKRTAHFAGVRKAAEASGRTVITGKAAKAIVRPYGGLNGYTKLDDMYWAGSESVRVAPTLKKLGKDAPTPVLIEHPTTSELIEAVEDKAFATALRKAGLVKAPKSSSSSRTGSSKVDKAKVAERERAAELEHEVRWRILDAIRGRVTATNQVSPADAIAVATEMWTLQTYGDAVEDMERLCVAYGWVDPPKKLGDPIKGRAEDIGAMRIPLLNASELWRVLLDLALINDVAVYDYGTMEMPARLVDAAKRHGVDPAAIRAEVLAASQAKADAEAAVQTATAANKGKPAARAKK